MIRRTIALALALLLPLLPLAGCWSRVEVNDLAIVSMMAVDQTEEGEIQLWLEVVIPARVGWAAGQDGGGGGAQSPFIALTARGRTVLEASRRIQLELPRRIFWAHMRIILIGERLARAGIRQVMDFLTRHRELRLTNYILVVRGSVPELLGAMADLEQVPAESIREIQHSRIGTAVMLGEVTRQLVARGADPVMGTITLRPPPAAASRDQHPGRLLTGTALFRDDRLIGFLDERLSRGLLWLQGEVQQGVVSVPVKGSQGFVSLEWIHSRVVRTARLERGRVVIYIRARTEGDVSEASAPLDLADPGTLAQISAGMSREIQDRMEAALQQLRELNVDAAGFGELIHRQLPGVWKRMEKDWKRDGFRNTKVVIQVDARVRRTGFSGQPRGYREEELIREGQ